MTVNELQPSDDTRSHGRQLAIGSLQGFLGAALSLPTGIVTAAVISRQLGPEQYGVLSTVCFIVGFIETAVSLGFEKATIKFTAATAGRQHSAGEVLGAQITVSTLAALILAASAPLVAGWMQAADMAFYLQVYAVGIPITGIGKIHQATIVGRGYYRLRACLNGSYWVIRMGLVIGLVLIRPSVTSVILANMVSTILVLAAARRVVRPAVVFPFKAKHLGYFWLVTWPLYFFTMCLHLSQTMDLILVKAWLPSKQAGFYAAAKNLTIVPGLVAMSLSPILLSKLSLLLARDEQQQAAKLLEYSSRGIVCLFPFAGMSAGAAVEVVQLIYGFEYVPAAPLLAILIFGALAMTLAQINTAGLIAAGRTRLPLAILGPVIPFAVAGHYWATGAYGAPGAAAVTTTAAAFTAALAILAAKFFWRVPSDLTLWFKSGAVTLLAWLTAAFWETPGAWLVLKLILISAGIVLSFRILGLFTGRDLRAVFNLQRAGRKQAPDH